MPVPLEKLDVCDPIWTTLRSQAEEIARGEPALASFAHATILKNARLEDALSFHLARKIGDDDVSPMLTREIFEEAMSADSTIATRVGSAAKTPRIQSSSAAITARCTMWLSTLD